MPGFIERSQHRAGGGSENVARDVSRGTNDTLRDSTLTFGNIGQKALSFRITPAMPVATITGGATTTPPDRPGCHISQGHE